ncbi:MAG: PAS domain S-box protein [Planctomycetes bacterium]|nr:PAS domain S-box protein [Planctomycetota bacterium]
MAALILSSITILVQIAALGLALRLGRITGKWLAWAAIASAVLLMTALHGLSLYNMVAAGLTPAPNPLPHVATLLVSALLTLGLAVLGTFFQAFNRAQQGLRKSQERLDNVRRTAEEGIWILNADDRTVYANEQAAHLVDLPLEQLVGQPAIETAHLVGMSDATERLARLHEGYSDQFETRLHGGTSNEKCILVSASPMMDEQGRYAGTVAMFTDIAECKRAEEALRASEAHYRTMIERLRETVYRMSLPDGRYEYVSPSALDTLGVAADELLDKPLLIHELIHPDCAEDFARMWKRLLAGEVPATYEYKIIDPAGHERWIIQSNAPVHDRDGNPVAIEGICRDITERKEAEEALRRRERYLTTVDRVARMLLPSLPEIPYENVLEIIGPASGASRVYVFLNSRGPDGNLRTSERAEWCAPGITAQIRNPRLQNLEFAEFSRHRLETLSRGEAISSCVADLSPDEQAFFVPLGIKAILLLPLIVDNEFVGLVGFDNCVDERPWQPIEVEFLSAAAADLAHAVKRCRAEEALRASEEQHRQLFEAATDAFLIFDLNGKVAAANRAACNMYGYSRNELVGLTGQRIIHADHYHKFESFKEQLRTTGRFFAESVDVRKGGTAFDVEVHGTAISYAGQPHLLAVVRDVTRRKRTAAALRESEERYRMIAEFASDCVYWRAPDGKPVYISSGCVENTGYTVEEFVALPELFVSIVHPADRALWEEHENDALNDGAPEPLEFRIITKLGQTRWVSHACRAIRDASNQFRGVRGSYRDITERKEAEQERERLISELKTALAKVKTLSGLLPICASCKKIRDDKGYWEQIEDYIRQRSEAEFSHGICPDCVRKLYPDLADHVERERKKREDRQEGRGRSSS